MIRLNKNIWIAFILFCVFAGCSRNDNDVVLVDANPQLYPEQEGWHSRLMLTKNGKNQAVVRYGHMIKYPEDETIYLDEGVEVDFYNAEGQHTSNLKSRKAEYHEESQDVKALGHVVVVSDSGVTLKSAELRWDSHIEKILSDSLIMLITEQQDTLFGKGFIAESDLSRRVIREPWGVANRSIDFNKFEESFQRPKVDKDTMTVKQDTLSEGSDASLD